MQLGSLSVLSIPRTQRPKHAHLRESCYVTISIMDVGERTVDEVLMVIAEKLIKVENSSVAVEEEIKKVEQCLVSCKWPT